MLTSWGNVTPSNKSSISRLVRKSKGGGGGNIAEIVVIYPSILNTLFYKQGWHFQERITYIPIIYFIKCISFYFYIYIFGGEGGGVAYIMKDTDYMSYIAKCSDNLA